MISYENVESQPLLSFIIPAYNSETSIRRCLDSIISQMDETYEIICVDDGSADGTSSILDMYGKRYKTVSVIHIANDGPSNARTRGIYAARGQYLAFVDSDDYFAKGHLAGIVAQVRANERHGVYIFGYLECNLPGTEPAEHQVSEDVDGVMPLSVFLDVYSRPENISLMNYLFNKVYRADVARSTSFDSSIFLGEDALYNYACYASCDDVFVSRKSGYIYENYSANSLSRGKRLDKVWAAYRTILEAIEPLLTAHKLSERLWLLQRSYVISALHEYLHRHTVSEEDRNTVTDILVYAHANSCAWQLSGIGVFDTLLMRCARAGHTGLGLLLCDIRRRLKR